MTQGRRIMSDVLDYINRAREGYPEITNDILCDNGAVWYMNGNDGTDFDWHCNNRCCEFYLFYKETEYGFIKVFVNRDGTINGYLYLDNGHGKAIYLEEENFGKDDALYLATLLKIEADDRNIYDESIDKINFDRNLEWYEMDVLEDEEDEE